MNIYMKRLQSGILLLILFTIISCESDLSKGVDSYYEGDYDKAIEHLSKVRYDDNDYDKAVKLIAEIYAIPRVVTEIATKRTFPTKVWANGKLNCSDECYFEGYISSTDCVNISVGDSCVIDAGAYMNEEFGGILTAINHKRYSTYLKDTILDITVNIPSESYKHMIPDDNPSYMPLRTGMSAYAEFITGYLHDVLCVPWDAVVQSSYRDDVKYVFIYGNEKVFQRSVKLGEMLTNHGNFMEVIDGVTEGEEIVSDANYIARGLRSGQTVIKKNIEENFK